MEEITTEVTLKLTFIEKVPDSMVDQHIEKEKNIANKRKYEQLVAKELGAIKADIRSIKHTLTSIDHEIFFDDSESHPHSRCIPNIEADLIKCIQGKATT